MSEALCYSAPRRADTGRDLQLKMQHLWLGGRLTPLGARLAVRHTFQLDERKPVEVVYAFALPRDAALRQFRIVGEGFEVTSDLKPVEEAQKAYEKGIAQGHLSALTKLYRDGLVNLTVGNIRPGETVTVHLELVAGVEAQDDGFRFRFPFTIAPCYHAAARYATTSSGEGEVELPESEFGDVIMPAWTVSGNLHEVGFGLDIDAGQEIGEVASPSHAVRIENSGPGAARASLAVGKDRPNRDLVLDVKLREPRPVAFGGVDENGAGRFAVALPSTAFGEPAAVPRNSVFLVDRSGSMSGIPIEQAKAAVSACLGALTREDRFSIVAFDNQTDCLSGSLPAATDDHRRQAEEFMKRVDARGGTELAYGVDAAAAILGGSAGEVFVLTDGQVFGGEDIIKRAKQKCIRLHCLGIGSASQDRFLTLLARSTGGVSRFVTPRERVDMAALELFAQVGRPVAQNLECAVEGLPGAELVAVPPSTVFEGTPVTVLGRCDGRGEGKLVVTWNGKKPGKLEVPLSVTDAPVGEDLRLLQGARVINDCESTMASDGSKQARRQEKHAMAHLEKLSLEYGLASRAAALVAVVKREGDVEGAPPSTHFVPVGMPQDVRFDFHFAPPTFADLAAAAYVAEPAEDFEASYAADLPRKPAKPRQTKDNTKEDILVRLAGRILSDGGMPGKDLSRRALNSAFTLLAFAQQGHQNGAGPFVPHVRRLTEFIKFAAINEDLPADLRTLLTMALAQAADVKPFKQDWTGMAQSCVLTKQADTPAVLILLAINISAEQGTPVRHVRHDNRSQT